MSQMSLTLSLLTITFFFLLHTPLISSSTFTLTNNCPYTVWPGILSGAGTAPLSTTGFTLQPGSTQPVTVPASWSGRLWGRTLCSTDSSGKFTCITGDCGSSTLPCSGAGATPPATLAEFTLNGADGKDFYDVSLVDGYNLPMLITPRSAAGQNGNCSATGCLVDLNGLCPNDLKVKSSDMDVACRSACEAFNTEQYCCSGAYGNPNTCKPSSYSQVFKNACPRAYSYAYDDGTSTFTCGEGADYEITFCPSVSSQKAGKSNPEAVDLPVINETMVFLGGDEVSSSVRGRNLLFDFPIVALFWLLILGLWRD